MAIKSIKGLSERYNVKPVEVERNELVLDQDSDGSYYVKADFRKGRSHANSGEFYAAKEGEAVIPASMRNAVSKALRSGNNKKVAELVNTLPKDTPEKSTYAVGANQIMGIVGDAIPAVSQLATSIFSKPKKTTLERITAPQLQQTFNATPYMNALQQQGSLTRRSILQSGGTGLQNRNAAILAQRQTQEGIANLSNQEANASRELQNQQNQLNFTAQRVNLNQANEEEMLNQQAVANKGAAVASAISGVGKVLSNTGNQLAKSESDAQMKNQIDEYLKSTNPIQAPTPTSLESLMFQSNDPSSADALNSVGDLAQSGRMDLSKLRFEATEPLVIPQLKYGKLFKKSKMFK